MTEVRERCVPVLVSLAFGGCAAWEPPWGVLRLDGSVKAEERTARIQQFNTDPDVHVFLVSTKARSGLHAAAVAPHALAEQAGGEGVNLTGGNRVVIVDVSWNPSDDGQAARRCYRFGQKKPVGARPCSACIAAHTHSAS